MDQEPYQPTASTFDNTAFKAAMTLVNMINPFEFQGTKSKSQFASLLDMGITYVSRDDSKEEQLPVPATQKNARLQLFGRANINSPEPLEYANGEIPNVTHIYTLMSEGPVFSITPPSNFTVRMLLEGYHKGLDTGIVGILGNENDGLGNHALRIRFYENAGGMPGRYVENTETLNKDTWSKDSRNPINRNAGTNNFANIPFTLTEAVSGDYFVVVDNQNYLPVMSFYSTRFEFEGDVDSTWSIESG